MRRRATRVSRGYLRAARRSCRAQVKGRKRHIVVDTLGLLLSVCMHVANARDRQGATPTPAMMKRSELHKFVVLPKRRVERTPAWICQCRRMSKDYEEKTSSSTALIYLAMTHLMIRR
jgi:putative transposase